MTDYRIGKKRLAALLPVGALLMVLSSFSDQPGILPPTDPRTMVLDSTVLSITPVGSKLSVPWDIEYGPDGWIWFVEQRGQVSRLNPATGQQQTLLTIPDVFFKRSMGLLGLAVGRDKVSKNQYVYVDYTSQAGGTPRLKVVRYTVQNDTLINPLVLLETIRASLDGGHNGSRIALAPDGKLMVSTGDGTHGNEAQDTASLSGKILRLNPDGSVPADNPMPGSYVWSWGHRNPQGLCFSPGGKLYSSEHGLANDDEINFVQKGRNYGWPIVQGIADTPAEKTFRETDPTVLPLKWWTPTIAPAGMAYYGHRAIPEWRNALLLTTLKECDGRTLRLNATGDAIRSERVWADRQLGRLRDVCVAPNGDVFVATSNRDWNPTCAGFPRPDDDQILRLRKVRILSRSEQARVRQQRQTLVARKEPGERLYEQHCAACHKPDGQGLAGTFPPLAGSEWVKEDRKLVDAVLRGLSEPIQVKNQPYTGVMPAFSFLTDQELADVLTYIRQSFGNQHSTITYKTVEKMREEPAKN